MLNFSKSFEGPALDYQSLMSLSNASRIDAIRAFDQLSHRLRSPSSSSRGSLASSSSPPRRRTPKHGGRRRPSGDGSSSTASSSEPPTPSPTRLSKSSSRQTERSAKEGIDRKETAAAGGRPSQSAGGSSRTAVENRISLLSISTDSTKLGEIPARKLRSRRHDADYYDSASDEYYNVAPTYPLKPYRPPEVRERRFWGFLRRQ